jgi:hypothetical protein
VDSRDFTNLQRQALLDLALLAMYSDAHLASAEDERLQRLLRDLGLDSEAERDYELDTAIARIRSESENADHRRSLITRMAHQFPTVAEKRQVLAALEDLLESDGKVAPAENQFLADVRRAMEL